VDSTLENIKIAERKVDIFEAVGVKKGQYVLFTCHREENVDERDRLNGIMDGVRRFSEESSLPVIFPAHPRTAKRLREFDLLNGLLTAASFKMIEPMGYLKALMLIKHAGIILTDSGGIQEESCILGTPCVTIRSSTERPETVAVGSNCVAGVHSDSIHAAGMKMLSIERKWDVPFGDGLATVRIADVVESALEGGAAVADLSRSLRNTFDETFLMKQVSVK
jgi:UDP-N-acetylglucosamine 2-epimerase (non-hydrolysing)